MFFCSLFRTGRSVVLSVGLARATGENVHRQLQIKFVCRQPTACLSEARHPLKRSERSLSNPRAVGLPRLRDELPNSGSGATARFSEDHPQENGQLIRA